MTEDKEFPASGAVFTFGRSRFADNIPSHFFIKNDPIIDMDCGDEHTAVVCQNGRVFVFGSNEWGQLGLGHRTVVTKPSCIKSLKPDHATHVACGRAHTIISTVSGKLFACGNNSDGQLGLGDTTDREGLTELGVDGSNVGTVEQLAAGCHHSAALNNRGEVFVWGSNADGQLGLGTDLKVVTTPTRLDIDKSIAKIACGYYHTVLLSVDGKVFGWGSNLNGQLGLSGLSEVLSPTLITALQDKVVKVVACGESHSAFITELGELLTCGETSHGKLGLETPAAGSESSCPQPTRVPRFKPFTVSKVRCGGCHTMVLASPRTDCDTDDHLSNGHVSHTTTNTDTLQPPQVDVLSPPIGARGPLPPLQRVPPVSSLSIEDKLSLGRPETSAEVTDVEGDLDKEDEIMSQPTPDTDSVHEKTSAFPEDDQENTIITLKHQDAYDSLRTQTQAVVETCESTVTKAKSDIEKKIDSTENGVAEKIQSLQKKSKMCTLL